MNMRKKEYRKATRLIKAAPATLLLWVGAPPIILSLLTLLHNAEHAAPLTAARATYLGRLVEYPVAAVMILTAGLALLSLTQRKKQ